MRGSRYNIRVYTVGILMNTISMSLCTLSMCRYGIELGMLILMLISGVMMVIGIYGLMEEVSNLYDEMDKY